VIIDGYGNRRFYGTYRGVVFDNQDPLGKNRLRLKIPQVLFDEITQWCWGQGSSANPAVGTGVWVTFEGGDPSFPVWAGVFGEATNSMADLKAISPVIYDPATATITLGQIDLANVGTPGTYTKVTTDTKGRVTSGTTLLSSDIPNIAESKVTNLVSDLALKAPLASPSFTTPSLGVATATSINGTAIPTSTTLLTTAAGSITSSMIANGAVLYVDIQGVSTTNTFLGRKTAGAGVVEELAANDAVTVINTATSAIAAVTGGTGKTTYVIGELLIGGATNTVVTIPDVATGNALLSGGVGTAPAYGKVGLTTHVTGTLPVANGGTSITTYAVGDLLVGNAANTLSTIAAATDGYVLTAKGIGDTPIWSPGVPTGTISQFAGLSAPNGYLFCQGQSLVRATYPGLFSVMTLSLGAVTVTIAAPGVFTLAAHGLQIGDSVYLTTTGALPTGLAANTNYYVATVPTTSTFTLTSAVTLTVSGRTVGATITTSGTQSGVHTLVQAPYGFASATVFNLPDMRGRVAVGELAGDYDLGVLGGDNLASAKTHTLVTDELALHSHPNTLGSATAASISHTHQHVAQGGLNSGSYIAINAGAGSLDAIGNYSYSGSINTDSAWFGSGATGSVTFERHTVTSNGPSSTRTTTIANANQSTGGGSHNNLQPYLTVNYIIKT
jgi:microcystin-dependent protein